ncbi:MAG: DinB family protein [Balneolaceae bacterium]|nr:DinB family protein [Balneolaceae bacterium]
MKATTLSLFVTLENQRNEIVSIYDQKSPEQLRYKPDPDHWNLLQVMRHLITAEQQSLKYVERKFAIRNNIKRTGTGAALRLIILKVAFFLPLKYKAPKIARVKEDEPDFETMKKEWDSVRDEMKMLIESATDQDLRKALYKHPRAGLLNICQMLDFMRIHLNHHKKQIYRILQGSGFPE